MAAWISYGPSRVPDVTDILRFGFSEPVWAARGGRPSVLDETVLLDLPFNQVHGAPIVAQAQRLSNSLTRGPSQRVLVNMYRAAKPLIRPPSAGCRVSLPSVLDP